ncbi:MAG: alpha/beta fold hydrolase, partial [Candidatus Binatia bacterium]
MTSLLFTLLIVCLANFDVYAGDLKNMERDGWRLRDMNPQLIEVDLDSNTRDCGEERCTFGLHYFTSEGFDLRVRGRKTILFIPGGPGQIVDRKARPLSFLEKEYNVVYFDVRGTGHSLVERSNRYDKYLRAEYVIKDIERIREALKIKTWDAIYAHSWGTIVAQQYARMSEDLSNAERMGNPERGAGNLVEKLILSAPVARRRKVTENDRNAMILSNIKEIY